MAHGRRRFVEALPTDPQAARIVAPIQQLYDVERAAAALDVEARRALRQEQSVPLLAHIDAVRQELTRTVLPKSPLGDALRYSHQSVDGIAAVRGRWSPGDR